MVICMNDILFTPAAVLDLLTKIEELFGLDIGITETMDNGIQIQIGESIYEIPGNAPEDVKVDNEVIEQVADINQDTYEELESEDGIELSDQIPIESGLIKEAAKSLLLGGLVRLTGKLLKNGDML